MAKRGVSNIEMILSFLLFIGFVFAALFFFTPGGSNNRLSDPSLSYAMREISQNASIELISYSVKLNANIPLDAKSVAIYFPPEVMAIPSDYKVHAEDYYGNIIPAERDLNTNIVYVDKNPNIEENSDFVIIMFSSDFTEHPVQEKPALDESYYQIASTTKRRVLSEKRIVILNESYYSEYSVLKKELSIPDSIDFAFSLHTNSGDTVAKRNIPSGINVFSTATSREALISLNDKILYSEITVQVW